MYRDRKTWPRGTAATQGAASDEVAMEARDGKRPDAYLNEESLREMGYAYVDLVIEYLKGLEGRRVYGPVSPAGMDDLFDEPLPEDGCEFHDILEECRTKLFPNTMAVGSRRYFGMMNPAPLPIAVFADALCAAMNQNVASWRHAPAATAIEKRVVRWLCELFGLGSSSFGSLVPGGSIANITGLKLAINHALKVWLAFKMVGRRQYAAWVKKDIELARSLAGLLRRELDFELIGPNTLGVCNFRWVPRQRNGSPRFTKGKIDQLNRDLQELVEQEGDAWFSHTILKGRVALRVNVENRRMEMTDIERLVRLLKRTAQRILQERDHTSLSRSNDVTP